MSKDWHHASKDRALLCTECRIFFKKYGEVRPVTRPSTPPPYLFRPVQPAELAAFDGDGVRTRHGARSGHARNDRWVVVHVRLIKCTAVGVKR